MNTNRLLTYVLYALLGGLTLIAIFKFCQMKEEHARVSQEEAEFQQTLRDFGYIEEDTTGSTFSGESSSYTDPMPAQTTVSPGGIEGEIPGTPAKQKPAATKPLQSPIKPVTQPTSTSKTSAQPATTAKSPDAGSYSDGRYRVVAGSFTVLDGARREMERLIKMGYHDAEVGKYNRGKYAVVIVKRTNSLSEANRLADELQRKGVDVRVIDRDRK